MPLLDIVSCTSLNCIFFAVFIFLSGETEKYYPSALKKFFQVMNIHEISHPKVIVTDKDLSLINAISIIFLQSFNFLCGWHINKNVFSHAICFKLFEKRSEEESIFISQWCEIVMSKTVVEYEKRWTIF